MKMKTLDDVIIELNGRLPEALKSPAKDGDIFMADKNVCVCNFESNRGWIVGSAEQFQQRAKELGYVNGYRWGIEYATDGKRPELADDVVVSVESKLYKIGQLSDAELAKWSWNVCVKFKITDQRHKPADTSYLVAVAPKPSEVITWNVPTPEYKVVATGFGGGGFINDIGGGSGGESGWYCYETQKSLRLPPVGVECEWMPPKPTKASWKRCTIDFIHGEIICVTNQCSHKEKQAIQNVLFRPLDHDRKAKAERQKVVDAAIKVHKTAYGTVEDCFNALYDKGFLKLPD